MDFQAVREQMAAFLRQQGVDAVCAYPEERRRQRSGPVAAVSLRCLLYTSPSPRDTR